MRAVQTIERELGTGCLPAAENPPHIGADAQRPIYIQAGA